jgi:nucleoside-diphosphate-sugar epimerase
MNKATYTFRICLLVHNRFELDDVHMHADDMVHALIRIALDAKPECPIYNVGSDEAVEIRDLARKIAAEHNVGVNITDIDSDSVDRYVPEIKRLSNLKARNNLTIIEDMSK